jgi:hypothetical protein
MLSANPRYQEQGKKRGLRILIPTMSTLASRPAGTPRPGCASWTRSLSCNAPTGRARGLPFASCAERTKNMHGKCNLYPRR